MGICAGTAIAVVGTGAITAGNILLNLLAVTFLLEVDDMMAYMLLPQQPLSAHYVSFSIKRSEVPWLRNRAVVGALVATTVFLGTVQLEDLFVVGVELSKERFGVVDGVEPEVGRSFHRSCPIL